MRNFWAVFAVMFAFTFAMTPMDAEAKKFGGKKSYGKLFKTAPAKKPTADNKATGSQPGATQNNLQNKKGSSKKGLMGGLLGGLLAGGLIGAMLGGAFEGIQFMDILIIALIAFVGFKIFRAMSQSKASSMNRPAYATGTPNNQSFERSPSEQSDRYAPPSFGRNTSYGSENSDVKNTENTVANTASNSTDAEDDVPFDLPSGFDLNGFLKGACDHYRTLQQAWNTSNFDTIKEYTSPQLAEELIAERATLSGEQHTEVMFLDADMVRAHQVFGTAQVSIKFSGRYKDNVEGIEEDITDIWHLERDLKEANAPWYIIGIES